MVVDHLAGQAALKIEHERDAAPPAEQPRKRNVGVAEERDPDHVERLAAGVAGESARLSKYQSPARFAALICQL